MYRNKMIELLSKEPQSIGSKLRDNALSDEITDDSEDSKFSKARCLIARINSIVEILHKAKRQYFKISDPEQQRIVHKEINTNISLANRAMKELKPLVEEVNRDYTMESKEGNKANLVQCKAVTLEANQAIQTLKEIEEQISDQMKSTLQREYRMVKGENLSQRDIDEFMVQPQQGEMMLKQALLGDYSAQIQNAVSDIIDKYNDVLSLKRNMEECLSMMQDLSDLVKLQGEKLLTIEQALEGAYDHVVKGQKKLQKGKEYHKKSQKKMCCVMMILLIIIGVIVIPVVITQV